MLDDARPELVTFLTGLRQSGETFWSTHEPKTLEDFRARGVGGAAWDADTKWQARFPDREIDALEAAHDVTFPPDYRAFLAILAGTNRPARRYAFEGAEIERQQDRFIFTDWLSTRPILEDTFDEVLGSILFDVENDIWIDAWGPRPDDLETCRATVRDLAAKAPKLIPIHGHRFFISGLDLSPAPVFSLMQTDLILYATSLEAMFHMDFPELCNGLPGAIDTEEQREAQVQAVSTVPFWGDLLT